MYQPQIQQHNMPQKGTPDGVTGGAGFAFSEITNQQASFISSTQEGHGFVPASNNASTNLTGGFTLAPPTFTTVSKLPQDDHRAPFPGQFQNPPSPAAQEWQRQKLQEDACNEAIDNLMVLVGLEKVKEQVLGIRDKVEVYKKQGADIKKERFNVIFQGNPGTGQSSSPFLLRSAYQIL